MNDVTQNPGTFSIIVGVLNALGFALKATPQIANHWIPFLLLCVGGFGYCVFEGFTRLNLGVGVSAALTAVGMHNLIRSTVDISLAKSIGPVEPPKQ